MLHPCTDPESFCQRGSDTDNVFLSFLFVFLVEKRGVKCHYKGPSSARERNAIQMSICWWADDGQTWNAGLVAL